MSFDCSRFTFNPLNDYLGVVMQQGRVQLDSDWNEWQAQFARRVQAGTMDIVGRAAYPINITPNAFQITPSSENGALTVSIGPGRMYVDGLLAENHGNIASLQWDAALAEMSGSPEVPGNSPPAPIAIDYFQQPYYPGALLPATGSPADSQLLFYLDVWKRAVTSIEDVNLIEKAVGVDTTGRIQTIWQVKSLPLNSSPGWTSYGNSSGQLPPDLQNLLLPRGNLTTGVVQLPSSGPCCLTPTTSYTGLENQLYRVEIHSPGQPLSLSSTPVTTIPEGTATFKWSRNNGAIATAVLGIDSTGTILTAASTGKDDVLCFSPGDWIEITDDWLELNGIQGQLLQIAPAGVDSANKLITLESSVQSTLLPDGVTTTLDPTQPLDPTRHTRIRRWDQGDQSSQNGQVFEAAGKTLWVDLNNPSNSSALVQNAPPGEIPVPPPGTTLILEDGITVTFGWDSTRAPFNSGDFWTFAARTADGSVEMLNNAPAQGIYHHYAPLAIVSFPSTVTDTRVPWPPECGCCCSISLRPEDLENDNLALQKACDSLASGAGGANGAAVCLAPGIYLLGQTLRLNANHSGLTIEGCHGTAILQTDPNADAANFSDGLVVVAGNNITLDGLGIEGVVSPLAGASPPVWWMIGLSIQSCSGVTIRNCDISSPGNSPSNTVTIAAGILASGRCSELTIEDNQFSGPYPAQVAFGFLMTGVAGQVALGHAEFRRNQFENLTIALFSIAITGAVGIRENTVSGCFGGFWLSNSDLGASLKQVAGANVAFPNIASALALLQPRLAPRIFIRVLPMTPQFQIVDNQMIAGSAELVSQTPASGWAVLISAGSVANSSLVLNANDLRASWSNYVVQITGVAYSSITSNVIVNLLPPAPPGTVGNAPLSLGIFPDGTATAVAGNVLFGQSNLGPGFTPRADIQPFDTTAIQQIPALAQLNTWKFLNYEPLPAVTPTPSPTPAPTPAPVPAPIPSPIPRPIPGPIVPTPGT